MLNEMGAGKMQGKQRWRGRREVEEVDVTLKPQKQTDEEKGHISVSQLTVQPAGHVLTFHYTVHYYAIHTKTCLSEVLYTHVCLFFDE